MINTTNGIATSMTINKTNPDGDDDDDGAVVLPDGDGDGSSETSLPSSSILRHRVIGVIILEDV